MHLFLALFLGLAAALTPAGTMADPVLLMAEEDGCLWCARWNAEIGPIYPKSAEGKTAPLRRIDIHAPVPDGIELTRPLFYTPTFVLLLDGREQGRIEGYPGEDFFWGLLGKMLQDAGVVVPPSG